MQTVKRDQLWDVLRGDEWRRARVIKVLPGWVNLQFLVADNPVKASASMISLVEMQNAEKFRFFAEGAEPPVVRRGNPDGC
jgi:hypothetical protein